MDDLKKAFQQFLDKDKETFIFIIARLSIFLLFFVSLYLPFIFETTVTNGKVSLSQLPGGSLFVIIIFLSIPAYFYFYLVENTKYTKIVLLVQAITSTLLYFYGILVLRIGFPSTATAGFGKHSGFVLLILIWFIFIMEPFTISLIKKYILKDNTTEPIKELEEE